MVTDFLGNTIEVGDQVIYTPAGHGAELVIAQVLDLTAEEYPSYRYDQEQDEYIPITAIRHIPKLQPLEGTHKGRFPKDGRARTVTLGDCSAVMLFNKKKEN